MFEDILQSKKQTFTYPNWSITIDYENKEFILEGNYEKFSFDLVVDAILDVRGKAKDKSFWNQKTYDLNEGWKWIDERK